MEFLVVKANRPTEFDEEANGEEMLEPAHAGDDMKKNNWNSRMIAAARN